MKKLKKLFQMEKNFIDGNLFLMKLVIIIDCHVYIMP